MEAALAVALSATDVALTTKTAAASKCDRALAAVSEATELLVASASAPLPTSRKSGGGEIGGAGSKCVAAVVAAYALDTTCRRMSHHPALGFSAHHVVPRLIDVVKAGAKDTNAAQPFVMCNALRALHAIARHDSQLVVTLLPSQLPHPQKFHDLTARILSFHILPYTFSAGKSIPADVFAFIKKGVEGCASGGAAKATHIPSFVDFSLRFAALRALHICISGPVSSSGHRRNCFDASGDSLAAAIDLVVSRVAFDLPLLSHASDAQVLEIGELLGHLLCMVQERSSNRGGGGASGRSPLATATAAGGGRPSGSEASGSRRGLSALWRGGSGAAPSGTGTNNSNNGGHDDPSPLPEDNEYGISFSVAMAVSALRQLGTLLNRFPKALHGFVIAGAAAVIIQANIGASMSRSSEKELSLNEIISAVWEALVGAPEIDDALRPHVAHFIVLAVRHLNEHYFLRCDSLRVALLGAFSCLISQRQQLTKHQLVAALNSTHAILQHLTGSFVAGDCASVLNELLHATSPLLAQTGTVATAASELLALMIRSSPFITSSVTRLLTAAGCTLVDHSVCGAGGVTSVRQEGVLLELLGLSRMLHAFGDGAADVFASAPQLRAAVIAAAIGIAYPEITGAVDDDERSDKLYRRLEAFTNCFTQLLKKQRRGRDSSSQAAEALDDRQQAVLLTALWGFVKASTARARAAAGSNSAMAYRTAACLLHCVCVAFRTASPTVLASTLQAPAHGSGPPTAATAVAAFLEPYIELPLQLPQHEESPLVTRCYSEALAVAQRIAAATSTAPALVPWDDVLRKSRAVSAAFAVLMKACVNGTAASLSFITSASSGVTDAATTAGGLDVGPRKVAVAVAGAASDALPVALLFRPAGFAPGDALGVPLPFGQPTTRAVALDNAIELLATVFSTAATFSDRRSVIVQVFDVLAEADAAIVSSPTSAGSRAHLAMAQGTLMWNVVVLLWRMLALDAQCNPETWASSKEAMQTARELHAQLVDVFLESSIAVVRFAAARAIAALDCLIGEANRAAAPFNLTALLVRARSSTSQLRHAVFPVVAAAAEWADASCLALLVSEVVSGMSFTSSASFLPTATTKQQAHAHSAHDLSSSELYSPVASVFVSLGILSDSARGNRTGAAAATAASIVQQLTTALASAPQCPLAQHLLLLLAIAAQQCGENTSSVPGADGILVSALVSSQAFPDVGIRHAQFHRPAMACLFHLMSRYAEIAVASGEQRRRVVDAVIADVAFRRRAAEVPTAASRAAMRLLSQLRIPFHTSLFNLFQDAPTAAARDVVGHLVLSHIHASAAYGSEPALAVMESALGACAAIAASRPSKEVRTFLAVPDPSSPAGDTGAAVREVEDLPEDAQSSRGLSAAAAGVQQKRASALSDDSSEIGSAEVSLKILALHVLRELLSSVVLIHGGRGGQSAAIDHATATAPSLQGVALVHRAASTLVQLATQADMAPALQPVALSAVLELLTRFGKSQVGGRPVLDDFAIQLTGLVRDLVRSPFTTGEVVVVGAAAVAGEENERRRGNKGAAGSCAQTSLVLNDIFQGEDGERAMERLYDANAREHSSICIEVVRLVEAALTSNVCTDSGAAKIAAAVGERLQHIDEKFHASPTNTTPTLSALVLNPLCGIGLAATLHTCCVAQSFPRSTTIASKLIMQAFCRKAIHEEDSPAFNSFCAATFVSLAAGMMGCGGGSFQLFAQGPRAAVLQECRSLILPPESMLPTSELLHMCASIAFAVSGHRVPLTDTQRCCFGVLLIGIATVDADDPRLLWRAVCALASLSAHPHWLAALKSVQQSIASGSSLVLRLTRLRIGVALASMLRVAERQSHRNVDFREAAEACEGIDAQLVQVLLNDPMPWAACHAGLLLLRSQAAAAEGDSSAEEKKEEGGELSAGAAKLVAIAARGLTLEGLLDAPPDLRKELADEVVLALRSSKPVAEALLHCCRCSRGRGAAGVMFLLSALPPRASAARMGVLLSIAQRFHDECAAAMVDRSNGAAALQQLLAEFEPHLVGDDPELRAGAVCFTAALSARLPVKQRLLVCAPIVASALRVALKAALASPRDEGMAVVDSAKQRVALLLVFLASIIDHDYFAEEAKYNIAHVGLMRCASAHPSAMRAVIAEMPAESAMRLRSLMQNRANAYPVAATSAAAAVAPTKGSTQHTSQGAPIAASRLSINIASFQ